MQYEFLKQFPERMKHVGRYALLISNNSQKAIWKQYGFMKAEEQINMLFAVLLYIMEQSLREEICTIDDVGAYIDNMNMQYFQKNMGYEESKLLGDFIVNVVLGNEGKAMYFDGFDFEDKAYKIMHISYVKNRVVYIDSELRRTSYYLTEDGYNLLLSTLEIEDNMKLTIHEMIFKMHLEKQSYDKAVDDIKNVFQQLHIQLQKNLDAMGRIRRNALNYTVAEYEKILAENLDTISDTKQRFQNYRELVKARTEELEKMNLNVRKLDEKEEENLNNLRIIEQYLNRAIDEHQKILSSHFDLKSLYTKELEQLSQVSAIRRFSFQNEFYDKIMERPESLERMDLFFRPLFLNDPSKTYNLGKVTELQRSVTKRSIAEEDEVLDFDEEDWQKEQERKRKEKLKKYETSLTCILDAAMETGTITLEELQKHLDESEAKRLIPTISIFKEVMVELLRGKEVDIDTLRQERSEFISDSSGEFQLNEMLLGITEKKGYDKIKRVRVYRVEDGKVVLFQNVEEESGSVRTIRCSNVQISVEREDE